ncbi:phage antirepressor KilAC domain-containing protein [Providencia rettgeri]|uniref:phage antirepressor KilAC domain-containing protein n=1 Tax=Providencia rettgeri TaxID=587 RepID=UPI0024492B16|nr:phage antirepressor KilAC domain-containing protein [Providencia rettgeri]MDH2372178.1 phage antirepressor KilAC domain-containing protein [Providencia rettgeri]
MNQIANLVNIYNGEVTMSSREISDLTGKRHDNVMADIRKMLVEIQSPEKLGDYTDTKNRTQQMLLLNKEECLCLISGYSIKLRMAIIKRWQELESKKPLIPQTLPEALRLAADLAEQKQIVEQQFAIAAPKAEFVDRYVQATGLLGFRETSKLLKVKENFFRDFLISKRIMYKLAGKLTPYSEHLEAGRFDVKTGENQVNGHAYTQVKFTPKGIQWIAGLLAMEQLEAA